MKIEQNGHFFETTNKFVIDQMLKNGGKEVVENSATTNKKPKAEPIKK